MKSMDIQRYIMTAFVSDPDMKPAVPDRIEHGGTIYAMMCKEFGLKSTPARSRIDRAFQQLEAFGWLRETIDSNCPIPAWSLSEPFVKACQNGHLTANIDLFDLSASEAIRLRLYSNDLKLVATRA